MGNQEKDPGSGEQLALLYGMQRTGSNFTQQVVLHNFRNIRFYNNDFARCLPVHKHFRLYDEKTVIPDIRYYNSFTYNGFSDFKRHVQQIAGQEINLFIVTIKDPYSWYVSYKKHARKNKFPFVKGSVNSHYIIDYNLYYRKWLDFSREAPGEVLIIKYEDLIDDLEASIQKVAKAFKLDRSSEQAVNPGKVPMSRKFTASRAAFYKDSKYLDLLNAREKYVLPHLLDQELLTAMDYNIR